MRSFFPSRSVALAAIGLVVAACGGGVSLGSTGAWLKERQRYLSYNVNVRVLTPNGQMQAVRIFENDSRGYLVSITQAPRARFDEGAWVLEEATRTEFTPPGTAQPRVERLKLPTLRWPTEISQEMVSVALLKPDRMSTIALFEYIRHLEANSQTSQRYEIEFWRKVFYPLSCMVMVVLALPFAYLHFRTSGITAFVFSGVLFGISFFLLNNMFGYIGNLRNWQPWLAAGAPGLIYMLLSLAAFTFLVLRR
jgi:lipopolysaccharide export system permease protein